MCHFRQCLALLSVLFAVHCGGGTAQDGTTPDAASDTVSSKPDSNDTVCCAVSAAPGCCMQYGGSAELHACGTVCDGMPWPTYPGWERRIDEKGCPFWWTPPDAPSGCAGPLPDARVDVDADAKSDADTTSDADATSHPDAVSEPDVRGDGDSGFCCPISPAPECCMQYGGSPTQFGCSTSCDGMPSPSYPGWERRIDVNGCPYWWTPSNAPIGCGVLRDAQGDIDA